MTAEHVNAMPGRDEPAVGPAADQLADEVLLATRITARDVAEYATQLVPTLGDDALDPLSDVTLARRLRALAQRHTCMSVIRARLNGSTWAAIAERMGMGEAAARELYADAEQRWRAGDRAPWSPVVRSIDDGAWVPVSSIAPVQVDDIGRVARELDVYCRQRITPDPRDRMGRRGRQWRPVSEGLRTIT